MKNNKTIGQVTLTAFLGLLSCLAIIPFLLILAVSFSSEEDIILNGYRLIPEHFDLSAYRYVLQNPGQILQAYKITIIFSVVGTAATVFFTALIAYPISRKDMAGRNIINTMLLVTMLFSGGLVPTYILNTRYLHLNNSIWIYIIPNLLSAWNIFMMRTFFSQLPDGIVEAAMIDGANQPRIFFTIILPLSKPVLATIAVMKFVAEWNSWYPSLLYIDDYSLVSLQYFLQRMMKNIALIKEMQEQGISMTSAMTVPAETARMAMAILVAGPVLFVFPFFQKYFVKGLTVGGVKG